MSQTPLLATRAIPSIPITGTSIGSDPTTTGSPGGNTTVEADLTELYALIAAAGSPALDDLSDVTITAPTLGDSLVYNGSIWVNGSASGGMPPIELLAGEIFSIPDRRQSLFSASLIFGIGSGISIGAGSAFIEVH